MVKKSSFQILFRWHPHHSICWSMYGLRKYLKIVWIIYESGVQTKNFNSVGQVSFYGIWNKYLLIAVCFAGNCIIIIAVQLNMLTLKCIFYNFFNVSQIGNLYSLHDNHYYLFTCNFSYSCEHYLFFCVNHHGRIRLQIFFSNLSVYTFHINTHLQLPTLQTIDNVSWCQSTVVHAVPVLQLQKKIP